MRRYRRVRIGKRGLRQDVVHGLIREDLGGVRLDISTRRVDQKQRRLQGRAEQMRIVSQARQQILPAPGIDRFLDMRAALRRRRRIRRHIRAIALGGSRTLESKRVGFIVVEMQCGERVPVDEVDTDRSI